MSSNMSSEDLARLQKEEEDRLFGSDVETDRDDDDDDDADDKSVKVAKKSFPIFRSKDDSSENSSDESDDDVDEEGNINIKKFLDTEAALSGDEASSDEEEDDEEEEEENEADKEELPDEDVQRDQIHKVFQKQQQDEDKRQLLIYQERLFEDGDLHMDGKTRKRKFAWNNVEQNGFLDEIYHSSDDDGEDGMNDTREGDDSELCSEVKINYRKVEREPLTTTITECDENSDTNNESAGPSSLMDGEASNDSHISSATSVMTTRGAFGGPAGSILSYVMRDKRTVDLLSNKRSPGLPNTLKRNIKKRKITRRPELR